MAPRRRAEKSGRSSRRRRRTTPEPSVFADFVDVVAALTAAEARFLIVGSYAMAAHGVPRATGDIDVWVEPQLDNARRVWRALVRFGAPLAAAGVTEGDFAAPGKVYQIGVPPRRIDVMTAIGVEFGEAWRTRLAGEFGGATVQFIGREALVRNKLAAGRPKDLADVHALRGHREDGVG